MNNASVTSRITPTSRPEVAAALSDQELLESALEFEKTAVFQQAEEEAKKARGKSEFLSRLAVLMDSILVTIESTMNSSKVHSFFKLPGSATNSAGLDANGRLKTELQSIVNLSKKRPVSDSSDDEVIPIKAPSPVVVRPPTKRLPTSRPDYDTFAPPNRRLPIEKHWFHCSAYSRSVETVGQRTKSILNNLGARRARGESVAMTQTIAEEQLRLREKLMRKPKAPPVDAKRLNCDLFSHVLSLCSV